MFRSISCVQKQLLYQIVAPSRRPCRRSRRRTICFVVFSDGNDDEDDDNYPKHIFEKQNVPELL